jgi:hypothetical protein
LNRIPAANLAEEDIFATRASFAAGTRTPRAGPLIVERALEDGPCEAPSGREEDFLVGMRLLENAASNNSGASNRKHRADRLG